MPATYRRHSPKNLVYIIYKGSCRLAGLRSPPLMAYAATVLIRGFVVRAATEASVILSCGQDRREPSALLDGRALAPPTP